jgi:hypothetical protein
MFYKATTKKAERLIRIDHTVAVDTDDWLHD